MSARVRLVRVQVHAEFVLDDGDTLEPLATQPMVVSAANWPAFLAGGWQASVAALQEQVDKASQSDADEAPAP